MRSTSPGRRSRGAFAGAALRQAIYPHVLGAATHSGTYTLNRRLL